MLNLLSADVKSNVLEIFLETVLPYIIVVIELMGILVVTWSSVNSFRKYIQKTFFKKEKWIRIM